jgi:hypothetical protein
MMIVMKMVRMIIMKTIIYFEALSSRNFSRASRLMWQQIWTAFSEWLPSLDVHTGKWLMDLNQGKKRAI